jgi:hypothetical protein
VFADHTQIDYCLYSQSGQFLESVTGRLCAAVDMIVNLLKVGDIRALGAGEGGCGSQAERDPYIGGVPPVLRQLHSNPSFFQRLIL